MTPAPAETIEELRQKLAEANETIRRLVAEMNGEPQSPPPPTISPISFAEYMKEAEKRPRPPFRPNSWYNADGDCIHVWFENESSYVTKLEGADYSDFEVMRSQNNDRIVGVEIYGIFRKHVARAVRAMLDRISDLRQERDRLRALFAAQPQQRQGDGDYRPGGDDDPTAQILCKLLELVLDRKPMQFEDMTTRWSRALKRVQEAVEKAAHPQPAAFDVEGMAGAIYTMIDKSGILRTDVMFRAHLKDSIAATIRAELERQAEGSVKHG